MSQWKEGDVVRIVSRPVSEDDRKANRYFAHMAGATGIVQTHYAEEEVAVKMDVASLSEISKDVHKVATERMREKFLGSVGEEQKKGYTKEELEFDAHYVLLLSAKDLEAA